MEAIESSKKTYRVSSDYTCFKTVDLIDADSAKEASQIYAKKYWPLDTVWIIVLVDDCEYRVTRECIFNAVPV